MLCDMQILYLPDHRHQHPRSEEIAVISSPDYLRFPLIIELGGATNFLTQDRFQTVYLHCLTIC